MGFASLKFIAFFLIVFALWYSFGGRLQGRLLLIANIVFYAASGPRNLIYIGITALSTYFAALSINRIYSEGDEQLAARKAELSKDERKALKASFKNRAKRVMVSCIALNIGILAAVKYSRMVVRTVPSWLIAPLAVSFYTFMAVAYLVDVYWRRYEAERGLWRFLSFITFFPQLVQGPISRFSDLSKTLYGKHEWDGRSVSCGALRVIWGYAKKLIVADRLAIALRTISSDAAGYRGAYVFLLILIYAVQLYADFTGGIDITIGLSRMLGIKVAENFNRPYFSKSTAEYWRRWHISMGSWFRDYVFYPLYTSRFMTGLSRKLKDAGHPAAAQRTTMWLCTLLLWALTGLWHGASMNFVVWGLLNGLIILASQELAPLYKRFHERFPGAANNTAYKAFCCLRTFMLMAAINVLDVYPGSGSALGQLLSVFGASNWGEAFAAAPSSLGLMPHDWIVVFIGVILMLLFSLRERKRDNFGDLSESGTLAFAAGGLMVLAILVFGIYGIGFDASQFIYNQF